MFKKLILGSIVALTLITFTANVQATSAPRQVVVDLKESNLKLEDLLAVSSEIAKSKSSKLVNKEIAGKIVEIDGKKYEIRYFAFEDTSSKLPKELTFQEYARDKNLLAMKSSLMQPLPGIHFESFDYRRMKLEDGVYFSMALRLLTK